MVAHHNLFLCIHKCCLFLDKSLFGFNFFNLNFFDKTLEFVLLDLKLLKQIIIGQNLTLVLWFWFWFCPLFFLLRFIIQETTFFRHRWWDWCFNLLLLNSKSIFKFYTFWWLWALLLHEFLEKFALFHILHAC